MSRTAALHLLVVMTVAGAACRQVPAAQPVPDAQPATATENEIAALKADVEVLKGKAPSASVAMADVGFHWSNLWFAGQSGNWPLAGYYFSEARNHIRWLTRINPMPKGPDGMPVDVKGIFDGIDTSTLAAVKAAIDKKDGKEFENGVPWRSRVLLSMSQGGWSAVSTADDSESPAANDHQSRRASKLAPVASCDIANDIEPTVSAGSGLAFSVPTTASSRRRASSWASLPRMRIAVRF